MLFAFARRLPEQIINQHGPHRYYWPTGMFEVEGQTMGILGMGKIGQSLAQKAKGLGMRVTGCAGPGRSISTKPYARPASVLAAPSRIRS